MGILGSLFGTNQKKMKVDVTVNTQRPVYNREQEIPAKKVSSTIQELFLISVAEKYKTNEKKYPDYFRADYGIGFPQEKFKELQEKGLIRLSTPGETLKNLKTADLKAILSEYGLKVSGKKDELCDRIRENVQEEELAKHISDRYWIVTEKGSKKLEDNPQFVYYFKAHEYRLQDIGLDVVSFSKLYTADNKNRVRDVLWGDLNQRSLFFYEKGMKTGSFRDYCEVLRTMALFLKEENRFKDALDTYARYLFYRDGFEAAIKTKKLSTVSRKDLGQFFYIEVEMLPFMAEELMSLCNGCEFDSTQLRSFMIASFARLSDTGVFSQEELADVIICGLNGDKAGEQGICNRVVDRLIKNKR